MADIHPVVRGFIGLTPDAEEARQAYIDHFVATESEGDLIRTENGFIAPNGRELVVAWVAGKWMWTPADGEGFDTPSKAPSRG